MEPLFRVDFARVTDGTTVPERPHDVAGEAAPCRASHHEDALLFDVALAAERERPWPLVAPAAAALA